MPFDGQFLTLCDSNLMHYPLSNGETGLLTKAVQQLDCNPTCLHVGTNLDIASSTLYKILTISAACYAHPMWNGQVSILQACSVKSATLASEVASQIAARMESATMSAS